MKLFTRNPLARGRWLRAALAWALAAAAAGAIAASLVVALMIAIDGGAPDIFLRMWRPMALVGAILALVFSGPIAWGGVWLLKRLGWPRPWGDIAAGAIAGPAAVLLVIGVARALNTIGEH